MGSLVLFHAHPDDEAISTGGTIARAVAEGHHVVLVVATDGRHGEAPDDLGPDETLVDRRRVELERSAALLGVHRVEWLGYHDSGMTGWEQNHDPAAFCQAPLDEAAERLAAILRREAADVVTVYDWHGNYGHPDHIQVHRVGHRAADLAGTRDLFEVTMNRDAIVEMMRLAAEMGERLGDDEQEGFDPDAPADDGNPFGTAEVDITHAVDVASYVTLKRASIACHTSQISDSAFFLQMPDEVFTRAFGTEWFIKRGDPGPMRPGWLFE